MFYDLWILPSRLNAAAVPNGRDQPHMGAVSGVIAPVGRSVYYSRGARTERNGNSDKGGTIVWTDFSGLGWQWMLPSAFGLLFYMVLAVLWLDDAAAAREAQTTPAEPVPSGWVVTASYGFAVWPQLGENHVMRRDSER